MDWFHFNPYQPYKRIRMNYFFLGLVLFMSIAWLSFTVGTMIYEVPHVIDEMHFLRIYPQYLRQLDHFLWLPYRGIGLMPWDSHRSLSISRTAQLFTLSVLWWAFLSFAPVIVDYYLVKIIKRRRR